MSRAWSGCALPAAPIANENEVHHLLDSHRLWSTGLGWVDLHLLAAARLAGWKLLSADRTLQREPMLAPTAPHKTFEIVRM